MADLVTVDVPESSGADDKELHPAKKRKVVASTAPVALLPPVPTLVERMRRHFLDSPSAQFLGLPLPQNITFKCITNLDGKSKAGRTPKVTKFVLCGGDGRAQDFSMVGRALFPRFSAEQAAAPSQFSTDSSPVDLSLCLACMGDEQQIAQLENLWPDYGQHSANFKANANKIMGCATTTLAGLMMDKSIDSMPGVDKARRAKLMKGTVDKTTAYLDDNWGAQLHTEDKDYFSAKRRVYDVNLATLQGLMSSSNTGSLSKDDENTLRTMGREAYRSITVIGEDGTDVTDQVWMNDELAPHNGDVVAVFMNICVIVAAGNYHISPQLKSVVMLQRRSASGGGGGFSDALKAIGLAQ